MTPPFCSESFIAMSYSVSCHAVNELDYSFIKFLSCNTDRKSEIGVHAKSPCHIGIFTSGIKNFLSFANEPHLDDGDVFTDDETNNMLKILREAVSSVREDHAKELLLNF